MSLPKKFLNQKVAVVTGASSGIGARVARALADTGVNLVLAARSADRLEQVRRELVEQTRVKAIAIPTDVSVPGTLQGLVDGAVAEFGGIDILVNNAGVDAFRNFHELEIDEIRSTVDVNLTGAMLLARLALPHMLQRGWGHIVNMASTAGKYGPPYGAAYGATKAGLIAFTQSLRIEYRNRGIGASAICPGFTDDGGIYEAIKADIGRGTPRVIGSTTVDAVARATIRAIRRDQPEVIVNHPPVRPFLVLTAMYPKLGEWLLRRFAGGFFRRIARARHAEEDSGTAQSRKAA
jgi:short-subunit dehydrogenase